MVDATDRGTWDGRLEAILSDAKVATLFRRTAIGVPDSRLASLARWLAHATKHSFLYRWLTKEPEPEVIVIDLRDTYTVGPVIAVLDRLATALAPSWHSSALKRLTDALVALGEAATETRTGRIIAKLLEPPEPRDSRRND